MDKAIVFVGCGGTFWTATPLLSALVKRFDLRENCFFVDPDTLSKGNLERQWVTEEATGLTNIKALLGSYAVLPVIISMNLDEDVLVQVCPIREFLEKGLLDGKDVIFVVNVDNDNARCDVRDFCRQHPHQAIMVMSGCDRYFGQVYTGWWENRQAYHDWSESHPDIDRGNKPNVDRCGQNVLSNAMTGVLLGAALQEILEYLEREAKPETILEWYWRRGDEDYKIHSWVEEVVPSGLVTV